MGKKHKASPQVASAQKKESWAGKAGSFLIGIAAKTKVNRFEEWMRAFFKPEESAEQLCKRASIKGTAVNLLLQMADAAGQPTHVVALPLTADQAIMMGGHLLAKAGAVLAKPSSGITVARGLLPPNGTFSKAG